MFKADMHVHSNFSFDGQHTMEQLVQKAIRQGLKYICFTEHIDVVSTRSNWRDYKFAPYKAEADRLNALYEGEITILKGIEFAEPYNHREIFDTFLQYDYDYILGAVHFIDGDSVAFKEIKNAENFNKRYYEEMYKLSMVKEIDAIAHFDHIRRGVGFDLYSEAELNDIFKLAVKNGTIIEINTSGIRRTKGQAFPDNKKLQLYKDCGGKRIVTGSDAHRESEIACNFAEAEKDIDGFEFENGVFIKRKFIPLA